MLIPTASSGQNIVAAGGDAWSYYRTVTVDNTGGAAHTDFPVMVSLTSGNFTFANADTDGHDLQFRAADGSTVLSYWREAYDDATDTATLWVKVPSVPANDTIDVRLYYGNGAASDISDITGVFLAGLDMREVQASELLAGDVTNSELMQFWGYNGSNRNILTPSSSFREQSPIYEDPADIAANRYKIWITDGSDIVLGVSPTGDVGSWSSLGAVSKPAVALQDPYIVRNIDGSMWRDGSGDIHMFAENNGTDNIDHFVSSDNGETWTYGDVGIIARGGTGEPDEDLAGSPVAIHDGVDKIYVIYEGINSGGSSETMNLAWMDDDFTNVTKATNNPLLEASALDWTSVSVVIDDAVFVDGERWIFYGHSGAGTAGRSGRATTTELDMASWDGATFSQYGPATLALGMSSTSSDVTIDHSSGGTRIVQPKNDNSALLQLDTTAGATAKVVRIPGIANPASGLEALRIYEDTDSLVMHPTSNLTSIGAAVVFPSMGIAADFELMWSAVQENGNSDDRFATIGFGDAATLPGAGSDRIGIGSGYTAIFANPTSATGLQIYEWSSSTASAAVGAFTTLNVADTNVVKTRRLQYLSDGTLNTSVGASTLSRSDSTYVSGNKRPFFGVAQNSSGFGAKLTTVWFAARPYDGTDPTQTVGSENST